MQETPYNLSEKETEVLYITPALKKAGWQDSQIRQQDAYTVGRVNVHLAKQNLWTRGKEKIPDYVLYQFLHLPIAVIEAKKFDAKSDKGLAQALSYAETTEGGLDVMFVYATNGQEFVEVDKSTGEQRFLKPDEFPSPTELWQRYCQAKGLTAEQAQNLAIPYYTGVTPRYYQYIAVNRAFEAILQGQRRVLMVMATGTGKTFMASQLLYRLRNVKGAGKVRRALFLVDRNVLADQTMKKDFNIFAPVMTKITNRKAEDTFEVYIALYQAVSGTEEAQNIYKQFKPTFFDLVMVDECHRGSADEDSAWREILTYFSSAIQVGLTATPKETSEASNIDYFGEPVYTYSLYRGIDDGFLAPFKIIRKVLDVDLRGYVPEAGKTDKISGNLIPTRLYNIIDFDKTLVIDERTQQVAATITEYLKSTDRMQKTIIFCRDIDHAERLKIALIAQNQDLVAQNAKYIMQITSGEEGEAGKAELDNFQHKEKKYPTLVTTSKLLTTGVDAPTVRLIVLDALIQSRTEFKQIIGRGTRIAEKFGKVFFTIMDFRGSTEQFRDADFDGEPIQDEDFEPNTGGVDEPEGGYEKTPKEPRPEPPNPPPPPAIKYVIDGVEVTLTDSFVRYYAGNGVIMNESFTDYTRRQAQTHFATLNDFLQKWNEADRKKTLLQELQNIGIFYDAVREELGEAGKTLDEFDLICYLAYGAKPLTRAERANHVRKQTPHAKYSQKAQQVIETLLEKYANEGITAIEEANDLKVKPFDSIGTPIEIVKLFGGKEQYFGMLKELKNILYENIA